MSFTEAQRNLLQTNKARDKAEALLERLVRAKAEADRQTEMAGGEGSHPMGGAAMNRAIASAQRMIQHLNNAMDIAREELTDPADVAESTEREDRRSLQSDAA